MGQGGVGTRVKGGGNMGEKGVGTGYGHLKLNLHFITLRRLKGIKKARI